MKCQTSKLTEVSPAAATDKANDVIKHLARQIRDEFINQSEVVVDKIRFDEKAPTNLKPQVGEKYSEKKLGEKKSSLKTSVKSIFKSVVNKIGVFKNKTTEKEISLRDGAKTSKKQDCEKSETISNVKNRKKQVCKNDEGDASSRTLSKNSHSQKTAPGTNTLKILDKKDSSRIERHASKRHREVEDKSHGSPIKKLKSTHTASDAYSDSLLGNFFNPVQPAKESSPLFKIPKVGASQPRLAEGGRLATTVLPKSDAMDQMVRLGGYVISMANFLRKEGIVPDADVEQFMHQDTDIMESERFSMMYDKLDVAKLGVPNTVYRVKDMEEVRDIYHKDWDVLRGVTSDKERKKLASLDFKNTVSANPSRNLTFHGYRSGQKLNLGNRRSIGSFVINCGVLEPLPGYKRKHSGYCQENERGEKLRKISFDDFGNFMKSLFFKKYQSKTKGGKLSQQQFDQFLDYLGHYKAGQEETENFLAFYSNKKAIKLDESQVEEVQDTESLFCRFKMFYGEADPAKCDWCNKFHFFSQ